ncbi:MAG: DUF6616 family protein [Anaerolineales bacterium]|jgi:hypothetical protein
MKSMEAPAFLIQERWRSFFQIDVLRSKGIVLGMENGYTAVNAEAHEKVGAKVTIACDSSWCSEEWPFWGVEEFPDLKAVKKFTALLNEHNWYQYFNSISVLGTATP